MRALAAAALAAVIMAGCGKSHEAAAPAAHAPTVKGIAIETVASGAGEEVVEAVGTIAAENTAVVAARVPGIVTAVAVREGDSVRRGGFLASITAEENDAGAAAAQSAADEALRALDEAHARKGLAEVTHERYARLLAEQAVTRQEYDTRAAERDVARQGVARAEARVAQARAQAKAAAVVSGFSRVTSPRAGVVVKRHVDPGATVFSGTPLVTVEGEGSRRLEAAVPETAAARIRLGQMVPVTVAGQPERLGRVQEIVPAADPVSRTVTVKIGVDGKGLRSGMFGRAAFTGEQRTTLTVPSGAVFRRGALTAVWVVDKENRARMRLVKPAGSRSGRTEIMAGLTAGERVAVNGGDGRIVDGALLQGK